MSGVIFGPFEERSRMAIYNLTTPLTEEMVRNLHVYDRVILNGTIFGFRVIAQRRIFEREMAPPVSLRGAVCFHLPDPGVKKAGGLWKKVCVGTSVSTPMDRFAPGLIEKYGVRAIAGRGGLSPGSLANMKKYGACYIAVPGGIAALVTERIMEVEAVHWEEIHPEALYQFRVKNLGPFPIAIDSHGNHLYLDAKAQLEKKLEKVYRQFEL